MNPGQSATRRMQPKGDYTYIVCHIGHSCTSIASRAQQFNQAAAEIVADPSLDEIVYEYGYV